MQAMLLLVVVAIAGIGLNWTVLGVVGALVLLAIGTAAFACLSMLIASMVKERERFMGIGQLVMMPLFFASSALYPLAIMPGWLKAIAHVNPLTYEVEGLRGFLLGRRASRIGRAGVPRMADRARRGRYRRVSAGDPVSAATIPPPYADDVPAGP